MVAQKKPAEPTVVNGINVDDLFALIEGVRREPAKGRTNWRVATTWQGQARSRAQVESFGGAIARVPKSETPYVNRDALYDCFPISIWDNPADDEAQIRWARDLWDAIRPFSAGGVYANNLGDEGADRVQAAYGENYPRLAALKSKYDPTNFFRLNQNIRPAL
jgi:Berberine and berberine like